MRYPALESLRGLAALVVVIHHHFNIIFFPYRTDATGIEAVLLYTPLHLIWAGGEAVSLFFVLSGFVLSLNSWNGQALNMRQFLLKRIWRIWIPFMVAITLAYLCAEVIGTTSVDTVPSWFNDNWKQASLPAYLEHALMLGNMDQYSGAFIGTAWSLKWEMWGSILFPLVLFWARQSTAIVLATCALLIVWHWENGMDANIVVGLMRYLSMFTIGALLSRHRTLIVNWAQRQNSPIILIIATVFFSIGWYGYSGDAGATRSIINDCGVLLASSLFISLALGWNRFQLWLERPVLHWLGRISFSMYLYHIVILTATVRLGWHILPVPVLLVLSFLLTFPVAHFAYEWVEKPAMSRGKVIAAKLV